MGFASGTYIEMLKFGVLAFAVLFLLVRLLIRN